MIEDLESERTELPEDIRGLYQEARSPAPSRAVLARFRQLGAEGIVSKRVDSTYRSGPKSRSLSRISASDLNAVTETELMAGM